LEDLKMFLKRCHLVNFLAGCCHDRLITTDSANDPVAVVVDVFGESSSPVGTAGDETLTVTVDAAVVFFAGAAFLGAADFGRPGFFLAGAGDEAVFCVAATFLATDFAGTAFLGAVFFCVDFFFAATFEVAAFLFGDFLSLMLGIIAME
jgi:hypothetical protein